MRLGDTSLPSGGPSVRLVALFVHTCHEALTKARCLLVMSDENRQPNLHAGAMNSAGWAREPSIPGCGARLDLGRCPDDATGLRTVHGECA